MANPTNSPTSAPEYNLHRDRSGAVDTLPETSKSAGINCSGYEYLHIQVVPSAAANPAAKVMFWSDAAGAFIDEHTPLTFAPKGAGVAWEATVDANGRIAFVAFTGGIGAADRVRAYTSLFRRDDR